MLEFIKLFDARTAFYLMEARSPFLVDFFWIVTLLGKWYIAGFIFLLAAAIFWRLNKKNYILPFFISVGGSTATTYLIKFLEARPRPGAALVAESSFSFPSGHATVAAALYGFIIYFLWKNLKSDFWRWFFLIFGLVLILLIGFSRLYLGVHYLSDVLGGYLVGAVWLGIALATLRKQKNVV